MPPRVFKKYFSTRRVFTSCASKSASIYCVYVEISKKIIPFRIFSLRLWGKIAFLCCLRKRIILSMQKTGLAKRWKICWKRWHKRSLHGGKMVDINVEHLLCKRFLTASGWVKEDFYFTESSFLIFIRHSWVLWRQIIIMECGRQM